MKATLSMLLLGLMACGCRSLAKDPSTGLANSVAAEMRRLAEADCPLPPLLYVLDGAWYEGYYGTVVGVMGPVVAIRMQQPEKWPEDVHHLLMPISSRHHSDGIKGNAVVVGRCGDNLICRFFPCRWQAKPPVGIGDEAWVDHATSYAMREGWRKQHR